MLRLRIALTPAFLFPQAGYPKTTQIFNLDIFAFRPRTTSLQHILTGHIISCLLSDGKSLTGSQLQFSQLEVY